MPPKPTEPRRAPDVTPDSLPDRRENLPGDQRRREHRELTPDSLPPRSSDDEASLETNTLAPDGGVAQHPIHDDDPSEDFTPGDYEQQIDKVEKEVRDRADLAGEDEETPIPGI